MAQTKKSQAKQETMGHQVVPADAHWLEACVPKFKLGETVWVIDRVRLGEFGDTQIRSYDISGYDLDGKFVLVLRGYMFNNMGLNMHHGRGELVPAPAGEIFRSKKIAARNACFTKVEFTEQIWKAAIGLGLKTGRHKYDEECQLGPCCAVISEIRDMLSKCMRDGGLIKLDIDRIQVLLDSHDHGEDRMKGALGKIFSALGCKIKD